MSNSKALVSKDMNNHLKVSYKAPYALHSFLQQLPDAVIVTSPEFVIRSINHAAELFLEAPASQFIGQLLNGAINFSFRHETQEEAMAKLFSEGIWNGEIVVHNKAAEACIFYANVSLLYDESGNVNSIVFVNHNINEEEKQLKLLNASENKYRIVVESLTEGVILINPNGQIMTANKEASKILRLSEEEILNTPIDLESWNAIHENGDPFLPEDFPVMRSLRDHIAINDVVMGLQFDDSNVTWISINTRPIKKIDQSFPDVVVATFKDITVEKQAAVQLRNTELMFSSFMSNSPMLASIYDEDGYFLYGNDLFYELTETDKAAIGLHVNQITSPHLSQSILTRNNQVLLTGQSLITEDELELKDGTVLTFLSNFFPLPGNGKRLIGGHAIDISNRKQDAQKIATLHERFTYVVNATTDAIWDLDLRTGEVYRSDTFLKMSGYNIEEVRSNVDWWYEKIHPEDRHRVAQKIDNQMMSQNSNWEDEYRFLHSDGHYIHILDRGFSIFENDTPVRQVGSMTDISSRKLLEEQLLAEQVQKQKLVNQAIINAQEEERNRISGELHDNVNQLLISAKLHISVAKKNKINQDEMLDKATEYLMSAVDEIRALSKRMNSKVVTKIGLLESISDIIYNMEYLNQIDVQTEIDLQLIHRLTEEQQLMVFRIVQEQTSNIIKHAKCTQANIMLIQRGNQAHLVVSDNGVGFDKEKQVLRSMGFINIFNRVDAYNGKVEVVTSPGNGCALVIGFPLSIVN